MGEVTKTIYLMVTAKPFRGRIRDNSIAAIERSSNQLRREIKGGLESLFIYYSPRFGPRQTAHLLAENLAGFDTNLREEKFLDLNFRYKLGNFVNMVPPDSSIIVTHWESIVPYLRKVGCNDESYRAGILRIRKWKNRTWASSLNRR